MRFTVALAVAVGAALGVSCSLPVESKTGCVVAADCVDGRVCVDSTCMDDACPQTCLLACELSEDCAAEVGDCDEPCTAQDGILAGYDEGACAEQWDHLVQRQCEDFSCFRGCQTACELAAQCLLIEDAVACSLGCQAFANPCPTSPTQCADVPTAALICYESRQPAGC